MYTADLNCYWYIIAAYIFIRDMSLWVMNYSDGNSNDILFGINLFSAPWCRPATHWPSLDGEGQAIVPRGPESGSQPPHRRERPAEVLHTSKDRGWIGPAGARNRSGKDDHAFLGKLCEGRNGTSELRAILLLLPQRVPSPPDMGERCSPQQQRSISSRKR